MESPEVVDTHHVVQPGHVGAPALPPGETGLFMVIPVVQGVAPVLALVGECVRRHTGHAGGPHILLELKEFWIAPHLRAVGGDIDGQVPDDGDALGVGIGFDRLPLAEEQVLQEHLESARLRQLRPVLLHGLGAAQAGLVGPVGQFLAAEVVLQRQKEGVIRQPVLLLFFKLLELGGILCSAPLKGFPQQRQLSLMEPGVIHPVRIVPAGIPQFILGQQLLLRQLIQIQKQRVSGKGRGGHIGGISPARRH